ncbi:MAG: HAD-IIIC family phosphatase [SAR324 cluster bacterium]|nr:HAD-IIIC family phosphatase [SAR324 cluster bacterium]
MIIPNFKHLKRNSKKSVVGLSERKIAILSDSASQYLVTALQGYGHESGHFFNVFAGGYQEIGSEILGTNSEMYQFEPDFVILFESLPKLKKSFYSQNNEQKNNYASAHLSKIDQYLDAIKTKLPSTKVIIFNFQETLDPVFGHYAAKVTSSLSYNIRMLNLGLMHLAQKTPNLHILDFDSLISQFGANNAHDDRLFVSSNVVTSLDFLPTVAKNISDVILANGGNFKKCLILDLDNTLWGGVIGDDGIERIEIGSLGIGQSFTQLQQWAKSLRERGVILAICSKNEEHVAREPFESHPDMTLRLDDIAIFIANWDDKVSNIRFIQQTLNIGFDSMVFLDDNPFERNLVQTHIPEITVPELPVDPVNYLPFLESLNLFEANSHSDNDAQRTKQYQQESDRAKTKQSFLSETEYLSDLEMQASCDPFSKFNIPRIAQLTQRSNQFNLRTVRYSEEDIKLIADHSNKFGFAFSLKDRFGDYGLISVLILEENDGGNLFIDTWLMSCRVLKRGMEKYVLNYLQDFSAKRGAKALIGEYNPTPKNMIVKDHYSSLGFIEMNGNFVNQTHNYEPLPTFIK